MRRILIAFLALALLISGGLWLLSKREADSKAAPVVLAAASLQESLEAAADLWARQGHRRPVLSFAASSALARQIEAGAPADLFISADQDWMNALAGKNLIRNPTRTTLLGNSLVLIAPVASRVSLKLEPGFPLVRALQGGRLAMADPAGVPAGRYGRQALEKLGVWDQVAGRVAAGDNVRATLALVAAGEAPLGIVYATDAKAEPRVRVVAAFPAGTHAPITYPLALLAGSRHREAERFRTFLLSRKGQAVFRRFGFTAPRR